MKDSTTQENTPVMKRQLSGVVVSTANDKTIVVEVERKLRHKLYGKLFARTRKFHVHDEKNQFAVGDTVAFEECRPMSKKKRWRVLYNSSETN